jgi:hypothetical protein
LNTRLRETLPTPLPNVVREGARAHYSPIHPLAALAHPLRYAPGIALSSLGSSNNPCLRGGLSSPRRGLTARRAAWSEPPRERVITFLIAPVFAVKTAKGHPVDGTVDPIIASLERPTSRLHHRAGRSTFDAKASLRERWEPRRASAPGDARDAAPARTLPPDRWGGSGGSAGRCRASWWGHDDPWPAVTLHEASATSVSGRLAL